MKKALSLSMILFAATAVAQSTDNPYQHLPDADPQLKLLVERVTNGKATAVKWFAGPSNLLGVIIGSTDRPNNPGVIAWATPDKKHLFLGQLVDANQRNLTSISAQHYKAIEPTISLSDLHTNGGPESLFSTANLKENLMSILSFMAGQGNAVASGTGSKTIYAFIDPFCPHCHDLTDQIASLPEYTTDMTIYYFPVFLDKSHLDAAAQIIANGADAIDVFKSGDGSNLPTPDDDAKARVTMNNALLLKIVEASGINTFATPTLVVQQQGKANIYQGNANKESLPAFLESVEQPTVTPIQELVNLPEN